MSEIINELKALEVKYGITYKNVRLGDLFVKPELKSIYPSTFNKVRDLSRVKTSEFNLPLINAKHGNNGIMYYGRSADFESISLSLGIIADGAVSTGDVNPQIKETGVLYNAYLIKPIFSVNRHSILYLTAIVQKAIRPFFGYENKATWDKVSQVIISLPHTPEGSIAIGFMEEFIATLERKRLATLDAYLSVKGWTIEDLGEKSKIQNQLTNLLENREIKWKDVKMSELFEIVNHTTIDKSSFKNNSTSTIGKYPYRTRTILNNGIEGYTDKELEYAKIEGKCIFVGMLGRKFFYEPNTFYAGQFTKSIYPKFEGFNKSVALYFIANFNKYHDAHVGLAVRYFNTTFYTHEISLPHTPEGDLDLEFMEDFIELIEKLKIHNVANELQTRINLTESIISNPN